MTVHSKYKTRDGSRQVVYDPDRSYGLAAGTFLNHHDVMTGLKFGTFTPGTIIKNREILYCVTGMVGCPQALKEVKQCTG